MENLSDKKIKVLCIGDSLALPGHGNRFEDTWFCKLQIHYSNFTFGSFFKRAINTKVLVTEGGGDEEFPLGADCLEFYLPNIVIIQLGIVDCAPRLIKRSSLFSKILEKSPEKLKSFIYKLIKKIKKRSSKNADITPDQFYNNLNNYLSRCKKNNVEKVILIKICTPNNTLKEKNPEIFDSIVFYNKIIDKLTEQNSFVNSIDPLNSNITHDIYADGYHPNKCGNELVFEEIIKILDIV